MNVLSGLTRRIWSHLGWLAVIKYSKIVYGIKGRQNITPGHHQLLSSTTAKCWNYRFQQSSPPKSLIIRQKQFEQKFVLTINLQTSALQRVNARVLYYHKRLSLIPDRASLFPVRIRAISLVNVVIINTVNMNTEKKNKLILFVVQRFVRVH